VISELQIVKYIQTRLIARRVILVIFQNQILQYAQAFALVKSE